MKSLTCLIAVAATLLLTGCGSDLLVVQRLQSLKPEPQQAADAPAPDVDDWQGQFEFAESMLEQGKPLAAVHWYSKCANGGHLPCIRQLGYAYMQGGAAGHDPYLGLELLTQSLDPEDAGMLNDLAWFLATSKISALRDPEQANEYIQQLQAMATLDAMSTDTLAAVAAALGNFAEAAKVQQQAITMLLKEGEIGEDMLTDYRKRLQLYRNNRMYTE
ncbi:hypothetical protein GCM10011369_06500 [Neiella marina]|uniref:Sel1 repeat family protein n=1 Tax=Neiella marina TaxID=508461 RepID=A0A8J2XND0_9GAMM|nr:hypothetical protein [Neiella marina]GGA67561.1 hypothetical protein GCM10011369_06500 [Neiella marina]